MDKDIRDSALYQEALSLYRGLRQPGTGQISDAAEVSAAPDGRHAVFAGTLVDKLEGSLPTRVCRTNLDTGETQVLTFGPHTDRLPKYSPDGLRVAFLSDRAKAGDFQLYLLDLKTGAAEATPPVEGWVEHLQWSPDGSHILLLVAGHGADVAGAQGAVTSKGAEALASWMPTVETGDESFKWRRVWVYEVASEAVRRVGPDRLNVWEAAWCGNESIAVVASPGPGEGLWYSARVNLIQIHSGECREIYKPRDQLGWPAGSASGEYLAIVEAICSDRGIVAGDLLLIESATGKAQRLDTHKVDVTHAEWRSDRLLLLAGHRGFDTVVGLYDVSRGNFAETWVSRELTTGGRYVSVSGFEGSGDCVLVGEGFLKAPEVAVIRGGEYRAARSFDLGYAQHTNVIDAVESLTWQAADGLDIQGWLLRPKGTAPFPVLMNIHGGPVWQWRPMWLGRNGAVMLMLLKRGYAVFLPNPRGSTGRGQEFARRVIGDMGGAEATDNLSGLDALVKRGLADPRRLAITGGSHGGFMTSWLIGQDTRFAAAVSVAPVINWVSEQLVSNIPDFVPISLADHYTNAGGSYFQRSPIMHAHKVKTPTLNICGALDRCTPPEEAVQFHNALRENGVESVLVMYPQEGHGVRKFPAVFDYAARVVGWLEKHIP